jgi:hypothetical protein
VPRLVWPPPPRSFEIYAIREGEKGRGSCRRRRPTTAGGEHVRGRGRRERLEKEGETKLKRMRD